VQFGDRIAALENSEGLYHLYNHPHWIKFMELACVARTTDGISRLREWASSHPQILPLLHRFDQCTKNYGGLTIDPFLFVPPSRLMYKKKFTKVESSPDKAATSTRSTGHLKAASTLCQRNPRLGATASQPLQSGTFQHRSFTVHPCQILRSDCRRQPPPVPTTLVVDPTVPTEQVESAVSFRYGPG
jgi:hypothetical protein